MADQQHAHADDEGVHVHIHSWKLYLAILGALLALTVATVGVSYVDVDELLSFGRGSEGVGIWNLGIALFIATIKAGLVLLFFMHLKDDKRFNAVFFLCSLLFIGVFIAYTTNDTMNRDRNGDRFHGAQVDPLTGERAPGGIEGPIPGEVLEEGLQGPAAPAAPAAPTEAAAEPTDATVIEDAPIDDLVEEILGEDDIEVGDEPAEDDGFIDAIMGDDGEAAADGEAETAEPETAEPEAAEPEAAPARVRRRRPAAPAAEQPAAEEPAAEEPAAEEPAAEEPAAEEPAAEEPEATEE